MSIVIALSQQLAYTHRAVFRPRPGAGRGYGWHPAHRAHIESGAATPPAALCRRCGEFCSRRKRTRKQQSARSARSGHSSRRSFGFDLLPAARLSLIFPCRRHKAAGDGTQTLAGRTPGIALAPSAPTAHTRPPPCSARCPGRAGATDRSLTVARARPRAQRTPSPYTHRTVFRPRPGAGRGY